MFSISQSQIDLIFCRNLFSDLFFCFASAASSICLCKSDLGWKLIDADEDNKTGTSEPSDGK